MIGENKNILTEQSQSDENIFCRFEPLVGLPPKIYNEDCKTTMARLPDSSVNLIIADPPYYKIKGEFDWAWETFDEYLEWMEELAKEFKRILADNGSLFVYSHWRRVAYIQVIFDKYFHLGNNIVWRKVECQTRRTDFEQSRYFAPVTERILFYDNETDMTDRDYIEKNYIAPRNPFSITIGRRMQELGLREMDFRKLRPSKNGNLTGWASNIILGESLPIKEDWELIEMLIKSGKTYEELRLEYEELRRPFFNIMKLEDVMDFSQEGQNSGQYDHETIKPLKLSKALVATCSREGDLVYIPFVGSGSECVAVNELNRKFIGSEINKKYVGIAEARIKGSRQNYDMFYD